MSSKAPRVLLLTGWFYPDSVGGTEMYVKALGHDLQRLGWDVAIAAPYDGDQLTHSIYEGLAVYRYPVAATPSRDEVQGRAAPQFFEQFTELLATLHPDVVHIHSYSRGLSLVHAGHIKAEGYPLLMTVHMPDVTCARGTLLHFGNSVCDGRLDTARCSACMLEKLGIPRAVAPLIQYLPAALRHPLQGVPRLGTVVNMPTLIANRHAVIHELFRLSDAIVVVSEWLYEMLVGNGVPASKITLSRHGLAPEQVVTPSSRREGSLSRPLAVGYLGRLTWVKGIHTLVEAVHTLPRDIPITLTIYGRAGSDEDRRYLAGILAGAQDDPRISYAGELTAANRSEVMAELDVLAIPSLWLETGPLVALEAFAAGLPVIGSRRGGLAELITDEVNGLLVEPEAVPAWRQALLRLVGEPELLPRLRAGIPAIRYSHTVGLEMATLYTHVQPNLGNHAAIESTS